MIKIKASIGDKGIVTLGLSHANLDRLRAEGLDGAIRIEGRELGLAADIWITAGETEAHMADHFRDGIGPHTVVHIDKKLKS
jgi:hypothetical protein